MAIDTGLSVPVFNVLKYLLIFLFIDVVVRRSLDGIQHFLRRLNLFHGRSVTIQKNIIDRYNLFRASSRVNFRHAIFWIALILCAYAVEICLEFSSDAVTTVVARKDRIILFNATHRACTFDEILSGNTINRIISLAAKCVDLDLEQNTYTMYNIYWELDDRRITTPLCVKTAENVRHHGNLIYDTIQYAEGSREAEASKRFLQDLRANSWNSSGDTEREVVTLQFTQKNVFDPRSSHKGNNTFLTAALSIPIPNTSVVCGGIIHGKIGEGQMLLRMAGCGQLVTSSDITSEEINSDTPNPVDLNFDESDTNASSSSFNFMYIAGTAAVFLDAKYMESKPWTAYVAALPEITLVNFTKGVIDGPDRARGQAYAALLSRTNGQDFESINKYAVAFKHCTSYRVPQESDEAREQEFSKARQEQRVTVVVYEWALATIILWPTLLGGVSLCLNLYGSRKGLPLHLFGERAITQRWASREVDRKLGDNVSTESDKEEGDVYAQRYSSRARRALFLAVEVGGEEDDIVGSYEYREVERDVSRKFKQV